MAFSEAQKVDIRFFLGYPNILIYKNPRLEGAMAVIGGYPEAQTKVEVLLAKLNAIYGVVPGDPSAIDKATQAAGLKKVESADDKVEYGDSSGAGNSSSAMLNSLNDFARQMVGALSSFLGVPIGSNVFGKSGYIGDKWTSWSDRSSFYMNM